MRLLYNCELHECREPRSESAGANGFGGKLQRYREAIRIKVGTGYGYYFKLNTPKRVKVQAGGRVNGGLVLKDLDDLTPDGAYGNVFLGAEANFDRAFGAKAIAIDLAVDTTTSKPVEFNKFDADFKLKPVVENKTTFGLSIKYININISIDHDKL